MENDKSTFENDNHKYQELIEIPNAVLFQLDLDWNYSSLNDEWTTITGYTIDETIETPFLSYVVEEEQEMLKEKFDSLTDGNKDSILSELKLVSKLGEINEFHLFLRADNNKKENITSFTGTLTCLSTRKDTIVDFYRNARNFQLMYENMTDMVAVLAEDGLVLYASPSHTTILGYKLDDYIGSYPLKHLHPDDWERMFHFFHQMVDSWSSLEIEYRSLHENGEWLHLEMKCTPLKGPSGETQVLCVTRDITARKKADEELRLATNKFKTLIASLPYGIKVEDPEGNVTLYNEAYKKTFSVDHQQTEESSLINEANYIKSDSEIYHRKKREIINNQQTRRSEEFHLVNNLIIERDAIPLIGDGNFDGYLWIFRDVTQEKLAERELQKANKLLKELSMQDGLTGIANRRCFDSRLEQEWFKNASRSDSISLLLLDIDFFKAFNDLYGHQAGDNCLIRVGNLLNQVVNNSHDLAARYGGEEFTVLLPGSNSREATIIAENIQQALSDAKITHKGSLIKDIVTLSIGISTKIANGLIEPQILIAEADKALYKAKQSGRNQIKVYS